jgi:hypothetical protein
MYAARFWQTQTGALAWSSNPRMPIVVNSKVAAVFCLLVGALTATLGAAPQPPAQDLPVSLDRIRKDAAKAPPALKLDVPLDAPVATFKVHVEQRVYVLSFYEWIDKEFKLTDLQRQSADWAAKCCGLSLEPLFKSLGNGLQRRKERKIREQIAGELAELEAARKNGS